MTRIFEKFGRGRDREGRKTSGLGLGRGSSSTPTAPPSAVVKNLDGSRTFLPTMDFDKLLMILDSI